MPINLDEHVDSILDELSTQNLATADTAIAQILNTPGIYKSGPAELGYQTPQGSLIPWQDLNEVILLAGTELIEKFGIRSAYLLDNRKHLEIDLSDEFLDYVKSRVRDGIHQMMTPITAEIRDSKIENGGFLYYWVPQSLDHRKIPFWTSKLRRFAEYADAVGWSLSLMYAPIPAEQTGLEVSVYLR